MEISSCFYWSYSEVITTKFCTWHNNGDTLKPIFHQIWNRLEKSFIIRIAQLYRLSIYRGHIQHDCVHSPTIIMTKLRSNFALTNSTPYLTLTGKLWGVFRELFEEKWPRYIEIAQYFHPSIFPLVCSLHSDSQCHSWLSVMHDSLSNEINMGEIDKGGPGDNVLGIT